MKIVTMTLGAYQTNCYLVYREDRNDCVVIDPGYQPEKILQQVRAMGKTVAAVLLTHCHFDHVGGVKGIAQVTGCPVCLCEADLSLPRELTAGELYYTDEYTDGQQLELAGLTFRVMQTPGHTPGCVCLFCGNAIFSGDTLFWGSCGRTDMPGGDMHQMTRSLRRLKNLAGDYTVYPGHGAPTTLDAERTHNPYME